RSHRREQLIELLWPEGEPGHARRSLRVALTWLRRELEPTGETPGAVLRADRLTVQLNPLAVSTDVAEFNAACSAGLVPGVVADGSGSPNGDGAAALAQTSPSHGERLPFLTRAVEIYQGELLPGYFEDWVLQERQWLAERFFQALAQLLDHL